MQIPIFAYYVLRACLVAALLIPNLTVNSVQAQGIGSRILVITNDGSVFAHDLVGNTVGVPFQLSGPRVAANPQDKFVLALGNRGRL